MNVVLLQDVDEGSGASFWNEVRSGAETGWDFSSRFLGVNLYYLLLSCEVCVTVMC